MFKWEATGGHVTISELSILILDGIAEHLILSELSIMTWEVISGYQTVCELSMWIC